MNSIKFIQKSHKNKLKIIYRFSIDKFELRHIHNQRLRVYHNNGLTRFYKARLFVQIPTVRSYSPNQNWIYKKHEWMNKIILLYMIHTF